MKNKYLMKFLCITLISTMVLASPVGIMASAVDGLDSAYSEEAGEDFGTGTPTPDPTGTPGTTVTPDPTPTGTPDSTVTPTPSPTPSDTPTPDPVTPTPTPEPEGISKEAQAVIDLISRIPGVVTLDCESAISKAENAYAQLSDNDKAEVYNYVELTEARRMLDELKNNQSKEPGDDPGADDEGGSNSFTDGGDNQGDEKNTNVQIGSKVTLGTSSLSNLHAGKGFYLDSLEENYKITFSDDFADVMDEIEQEYKDANKLVDVSDTTEDRLTSSWDNLLVRNWQDILAIYIYQQNKNGAETYTLDASAKDDLAEIFAMMNPVVRDKKNITKVSYGNYHINYYIKKNKISKEDRESLKTYTETDCKLLCAVVTDAKGFIRQSVGDDVSEERVNVIAAAYSLVGKVGYFWGGKSTVIGEDPSWGSAATVDASGSKTSGSTRAYGLDCSGFVTWAVINGYLDQGMQGSVGDGTSDQWLKANTVSEEDAQPGDLVFQKGPEAGSDNHVGIICGQTDAGDWIAVHCSSSKNGVTVGEAYSASFRYIRQPAFYPTEEELAEISKEKAQNTSILAASGDSENHLATENGDTGSKKTLTILEDEESESDDSNSFQGLEVLD